MIKDQTQNQTDSCNACVNNERRQFIQSAVAAIIAVVGISLLDPADAVAEITAISTGASSARNRVKYAIPPADSVNIDTKNEVIIARSGANVYAFALACPHQNTALRWLQKDGRFQCPKHKSKYSPAGEFINGRATRNMDRLPISLDGTLLAVETSHEIRSDTEAVNWAAAVVHIAS